MSDSSSLFVIIITGILGFIPIIWLNVSSPPIPAIISSKKILWVDDEIELLRSHIIFLLEKGYEVDTVTNGEDAISSVKDKNFDLIFLDEMKKSRPICHVKGRRVNIQNREFNRKSTTTHEAKLTEYILGIFS